MVLNFISSFINSVLPLRERQEKTLISRLPITHNQLVYKEETSLDRLITSQETLTTQDLNNLILQDRKNKTLHALAKARQEYESFRKRIETGKSVENSLGYLTYTMIKPNKKEGDYGVKQGYNEKLKSKFESWTNSGKNSQIKNLRKAVVEDDFELFKKHYTTNINETDLQKRFLKAKADFGTKVVSKYLTEQSFNKIQEIHHLISKGNSFKNYLDYNYFSRAKDMDKPKRFDYNSKNQIYKNRHGEFDLNKIKPYLPTLDYLLTF